MEPSLDDAGVQHRPAVTQLRISAYKSHRHARFRLGPLTLFAGGSGTGKSSALEAYQALARLSAGDELADVFTDPVSCVPERALPDPQWRRGFRLGCTVDGPVGRVRLDVAIQVEPELRVAGERLSVDGRSLFTTAQRDPGRRTVQAAWHTAGAVPVTRAPLPDDRLGTALLPLRVAGKTAGQRLVLDATEQVLVALRATFACDPRPELMRGPVRRGPGLLRSDCRNLADVLLRTSGECRTRHAALVTAARAGCVGPVEEVVAREAESGMVSAVLDRGRLPATPVGRLGDGELRFVALALVLLTGPGVLSVEPVAEVPTARQRLTVLADDVDRSLDGRQLTHLTELAVRMCRRGHIRMLATVRDGRLVGEVEGVSVVPTPAERATDDGCGDAPAW